MVQLLAGVVLSLILLLPHTALAGTVQIPQTGQTTCYNSSGQVVTCAGTGQDGDIRAGAPWPNPRFVDNGDDTMTDRTTGLVWPKDGGTPSVGSCTGGTMTWYAALEYVKCLNDRGYLGHSDWRLPNVNELESLTNGSNFISYWLKRQGFRNVVNDRYWSSTTSPVNSSYAFFVELDWGSVAYEDKSVNFVFGNIDVYVWPVRAGQTTYHKTGQTTSYAAGDDGDLERGVAWPAVRFSDRGNGTVSDKLTGLM